MIELSKSDISRNIKFPSESKDFAEFLGIMTGDGYIGQYKLKGRIISNLEISGNKVKDYDYMNDFLISLIKDLFNLKPNVYMRDSDNTIRIIIYSKGILLFLKNLGFPLGYKGDLVPPEWIINNSEFFKSYIRGIFDTDGNLCLKKKEGKKYPVLSLASNSRPLIEVTKKFLAKLGISSYLDSKKNKVSKGKKQTFCYQVQINGNNNICLFFKEIGSNNHRNQIKYKEMCELYN